MQIINFTLNVRFEALTVVVVKIQTSSDFVLRQLVNSDVLEEYDASKL
jgi:hypothetical protein